MPDGSGTTALVARKLGRRAIGVDNCKACKRLRQKAQRRLAALAEDTA